MVKYRNKNWLYKQYHMQHLSLREISKQCDVGGSTIHHWMQYHNISRRSNINKYGIEKCRLKAIGKHHSGEWNKAISNGTKGRKVSEKTKEKLRKCFTGRKLELYHKKKLQLV